MKPLCIDLFCGLGGWTEGFLAEGYQVIGFDIERHVYGEHRYPGELVLQDVLTLHGRQFCDAAVIVASPPCQEYSYRAMPWKRAKALPPPSNELFDACFRIAREAGEAATTAYGCARCGIYHPATRFFDCTFTPRQIPLVIENVKGAQPWVGRAKWHYGSFYLWGDVPALMPSARHLKVAGFNFHQHEKTGQPGGSFQSAAVKNSGTAGGSWFNVAHGKVIPGNQAGAPQRGDGLKTVIPHWRMGAESGTKCHGQKHGEEYAMTRGPVEGIEQHGSGPEWFDTGIAKHSSHSDSRKAASALIAKIPFELSSYIARVFKPPLY